ncbi:hypothetical protein SRHO_G00300840 [Serrasalmus rhombeus]
MHPGNLVPPALWLFLKLGYGEIFQQLRAPVLTETPLRVLRSAAGFHWSASARAHSATHSASLRAHRASPSISINKVQRSRKRGFIGNSRTPSGTLSAFSSTPPLFFSSKFCRDHCKATQTDADGCEALKGRLLSHFLS